MVGLTIILAGVVEYDAVRTLTGSSQWIGHRFQVLQEISATRSVAKAAERAASGYALTGDPVYLDTLRESVAGANQHERELRTLTADNPRQQMRLNQLETLLEKRFQMLDELTGKRRLLGAEAAIEFAQSNTGTSLAADIDSLGQEFENEESSLLSGRRADLERMTNTAQIVTVAAAAFSLLLLAAASTVTGYDLRRRRRLETELRYEKDLFTTLMDSVPASVYFKDRESRFLRINAAMGRRLRLVNLADAIGKTDADFYGPARAAETLAEEQAVIQTGRAMLDKEEMEVQSDGRAFWFLSSKLPMLDRAGSIAGTFCLSRDITGTRQTEADLESANSKLTGWNSQLELRNREIMLLGEMGELLQTCVVETEAERILIQFAHGLCPGLSGALCMIKASRNLVERTANWGEATMLAPAYSPDDCWALRRGRPHTSGSSNERIKCAHIDEAFAGSFVCVPMMAHGETLGVLHLLRQDGQDLDEPELRMGNMLAERMALAIANLRLREALKAQSIRDPLTSLFNRRYMEESLERELHRADRDQGTIGAIMLDLDHFKRFNDHFGHDGGDAILKEFSRVLLTRARKEDIICRYGGEEFLIILPGASLDDTRRRAESLLSAVRDLNVSSSGQELGPVSASIGVALYPKDADNGASLIRAADGALYQAKTHGRDRVVLAATHPAQASLGRAVSAR